jgi:hypothetical protein
MIVGLFGHFSDAGQVEMIVFAICSADRLNRVGAVVLIVRHAFDGGNLASEIIETVDPDVDNAFALLDEIFANQITSIRDFLISVSCELAVCILSRGKSTL